MAYALNTHYANGSWLLGAEMFDPGYFFDAINISDLVSQIELSCWATASLANGRPADPENVGQSGFQGGPPDLVRPDININANSGYLVSIIANVANAVNEKYPASATDPELQGDIFNDPGYDDSNPPAFWMTVEGIMNGLNVTNETAQRIATSGTMQGIRLMETVLELIYPKDVRGCVLYGLFAGLTIAAVMAVALRIFARHRISGRIKHYDWTIVLALILAVTWGIIAILQANLLSRRLCNSSLHQLYSGETYFTALDILYPVTLFVIKVSLLLFYCSLTPWRPLRIATIVTFVFTVASTVFSIVVAAKSFSQVCYWPQLFNLEDDATAAVLESALKLVIAAGSLGILNDLVIWLLPLPMIWMLQLNRRERALAILTFGFGLLACIASGLRIHAIRKFLDINLDTRGDNYYTAIDINKWAMVEMNLSIICSSVPALRVLVAKYVPGFATPYSGSGGIRMDLREISQLNGEIKVSSNLESPGGKLQSPGSRGTADTSVPQDTATGGHPNSAPGRMIAMKKLRHPRGDQVSVGVQSDG